MNDTSTLQATRRPRSPTALATAALLVCAQLSGCGSLLPRSSVEARSPFDSYEAAQRALERIEPYKTPASDLVALGFDLADARNVRIIPYPDLVARLAPHAGVALADIDPGLRDCILARLGCQAFEFKLTRETRTREGNFLLDFLNFQRHTAVSGWRFEALVVVRDGIVLFRSAGGEPRIDQLEQVRNPLGPLQSIGESAAARIKR
ncbi:hypothetical protein [Ideonella sp. A 288]|uniref:hypothetical protein n=1 Tax=Ideonella sp. A 288 TaxID=1962181 RepID=UPI00118473E8|nr:hypothetical protein [Ideonella sp. A 288]